MGFVKASNFPRIALMMVVKNESKALPKLIESVLPLISSWVIIDTGSTDDTKTLITELLSEVPGELHDRSWVNFGHNRTELMSMIPVDSDYAFLLDADHVVEIPNPIFNQQGELVLELPAADCYMLKVIDGETTYRMPYLVKSRNDFHFVGATHEYLTSRNELHWVDFDYFQIVHTDEGGAKADKHERDLKLLLQEVAENPTGRAYFYLGQTYWGLGELEKAIDSYKTCAVESDWDEERYFALLRAGRVQVQIGRHEQALISFLQASGHYINRTEALVEASKIYAQFGLYKKALQELEEAKTRCPQSGRLMVEEQLGELGIEIQMGVLDWQSGDIPSARSRFERLLDWPNLPPKSEELIRNNLKYC